MFTSGSMYEEIENARLAKINKRKKIKKKITIISLLVFILLYLFILLIDISRFRNGENPLIVLSYSKKEYDDGIVETYKSIGWLFRYYKRETISQNEMAPFWSGIKMDDKLNRNVNDPSLPKIEKYEIPGNPNKSSMVDGVLFFYDNNQKFLGTYKCILSERDCEVAKSAYLNNDRNVRNSDVKMGIIEDRYVFIREYKSKNTQAEESLIYLYDIVANDIIAAYQDVRYTILGNKDEYNHVGLIDSSKYIVKKNNLWGIDEVIKGKVTNFEEYKYQYINYDEETKIYIFQTPKDEWGNYSWIAYNANTKVYSKEIKEIIASLFNKNDKMYIIAYTYADEYSNTKNYILYNENGENVLSKDGINDLKAYDNFLIYTKDNNLFIINYDGNELISSIKLYFDNKNNYSGIKPYNIKFLGDTIIISTPKDQTKTHLTTQYQYNKNTFELIKTIDNVKETIE